MDVQNADASRHQSEHFAYIDALRGYAILLVIIGHCVFMIGDLPSWITSSALAYGGRGVQLFFVVSAITLMSSWNSRQDGALPFYVRRIFRIAPMWWLAMVYWLIRMGFGPRYYAPDGVSTVYIWLNALLLNGLLPHASMAIVPGGWSIACEVLFYILFPILACFCKDVARSFVLIALTIGLKIAADHLFFDAKIFQPESLRAAFLDFSFSNQLPVFALGICTFQAMRRIELSQVDAAAIVITAIVLFAVLPYGTVVSPTPIAYGFCWALLAHGVAQNGAGNLFINRPIIMLGRWSYSAYFWHFIFLDNPVDHARLTGGILALAILLVKTLAFTVPASWLTYTCIEDPSRKLGSQLIIAIQRKTAP